MDIESNFSLNSYLLIQRSSQFSGIIKKVSLCDGQQLIENYFLVVSVQRINDGGASSQNGMWISHPLPKAQGPPERGSKHSKSQRLGSTGALDTTRALMNTQRLGLPA